MKENFFDVNLVKKGMRLRLDAAAAHGMVSGDYLWGTVICAYKRKGIKKFSMKWDNCKTIQRNYTHESINVFHQYWDMSDALFNNDLKKALTDE